MLIDVRSMFRAMYISTLNSPPLTDLSPEGDAEFERWCIHIDALKTILITLQETPLMLVEVTGDEDFTFVD